MEKYIEQEIEQQLNNIAEELNLPYKLYISSDRQFKNDLLRNNEMYVVYKETSGEVIDGNKRVPLNFYVISEQNSLNYAKQICELFLLRYNQVNMEFYEDNVRIVVAPFYGTPVVLSNFVNAGLGTRAIMYFNGYLIIMKGLNDIKSITYIAEDGSEEDVSYIQVNEGFINQTDTAAFYNRSSYSESIAQFGSYNITFDSQFKDSKLINTILGIQYNDKSLAPNGVDTIFTFKIEYQNGIVGIKNTRLTQFNKQQKLGIMTILRIDFRE